MARRYDGKPKEHWTCVSLPDHTVNNLKFFIGDSGVPYYVFLDNLLSNYNTLVRLNEQLRARIMEPINDDTVKLKPLLPPRSKLFSWLKDNDEVPSNNTLPEVAEVPPT
jgi:hypothetical protein